MCAALGGGRAAGERGDAEARGGEQPHDGHRVLLRQDFGRRHERDLQPVLERDQRREQRDDGLADADVALEEAVHRLGARHVARRFRATRLSVRRSGERQYRARGLADAIVDDRHERLALGFSARRPSATPSLEEEELFEDQPHLRGAAERVQQLRRSSSRRAESARP